MKFSTVFFGLSLLASCQQQDSTFAQVVPSSTGALWTIQVPSTKERIPHHAYKFYRNGQCAYYLLSKQGTWRRYGRGDDEVTNTWLVRRDTLSINGVDSKLLAVKRDTIYLYDFVACDTLILVKAK
jgi:hypothetical protein